MIEKNDVSMFREKEGKRNYISLMFFSLNVKIFDSRKCRIVLNVMKNDFTPLENRFYAQQQPGVNLFIHLISYGNSS